MARAPTPTPSTSTRQLFEVLVRDNSEMLSAYLRSLVRDPGTVDDLFQETIIVAWRRLDDFDRSRPFGAWLRGIASRLAMARHRGQGRVMFRDDMETIGEIDRRFDSLGGSTAESFRERAGMLAQCLGELPDLLRQVVELAYAKSLLLSEIALAVTATEEAVKKRVQRARALLADCLERRGISA